MMRAPIKANAAQIISALIGLVRPIQKPPVAIYGCESRGLHATGKEKMCCIATEM